MHGENPKQNDVVHVWDVKLIATHRSTHWLHQDSVPGVAQWTEPRIGNLSAEATPGVARAQVPDLKNKKAIDKKGLVPITSHVQNEWVYRNIFIYFRKYDLRKNLTHHDNF